MFEHLRGSGRGTARPCEFSDVLPIVTTVIVLVLGAAGPLAFAMRRGYSDQAIASLGGALIAVIMSSAVLLVVTYQAERSADEIQARAEDSADAQTSRADRTARELQAKALRAETEAEARRAVGAARLMQLEFNRRIVDLRSTLCRTRSTTGPEVVGFFPTRQTTLMSSMSSEDRRAVASALEDHAAWRAVMAADVSVHRAQRLFDDRLGARVTPVERRQLRAYVRDFARAGRSLADITEQQLPRVSRCGSGGGTPWSGVSR